VWWHEQREVIDGLSFWCVVACGHQREVIDGLSFWCVVACGHQRAHLRPHCKLCASARQWWHRLSLLSAALSAPPLRQMSGYAWEIDPEDLDYGSPPTRLGVGSYGGACAG